MKEFNKEVAEDIKLLAKGVGDLGSWQSAVKDFNVLVERENNKSLLKTAMAYPGFWFLMTAIVVFSDKGGHVLDLLRKSIFGN